MTKNHKVKVHRDILRVHEVSDDPCHVPVDASACAPSSRVHKPDVKRFVRSQMLPTRRNNPLKDGPQFEFIARVMYRGSTNSRRASKAIGQIQTAMIIGCAFIEALTIYALLTVILLQGKLG